MGSCFKSQNTFPARHAKLYMNVCVYKHDETWLHMIQVVDGCQDKWLIPLDGAVTRAESGGIIIALQEHAAEIRSA